MESLDLFLCTITFINLVIGVVNTYWAYERTKYNEKVYKGSEAYWSSWKVRSKDITKKVLKEISSEQLEFELEKRRKKLKQGVV